MDIAIITASWQSLALYTLVTFLTGSVLSGILIFKMSIAMARSIASIQQNNQQNR